MDTINPEYLAYLMSLPAHPNNGKMVKKMINIPFTGTKVGLMLELRNFIAEDAKGKKPSEYFPDTWHDFTSNGYECDCHFDNVTDKDDEAIPGKVNVIAYYTARKPGSDYIETNCMEWLFTFEATLNDDGSVSIVDTTD